MNTTLQLNREILFGLLATFVFYLSIGAFGAFVKDLYDNFTNVNKRIQLSEVFIAAVSTAFIFIGLQDYLYDKFSLNVIVLMAFVCGVLGFEIFGKINSIRGLQTSVLEFIRIKKTMDQEISVEQVSTILKEERAIEERERQVQKPPPQEPQVVENQPSKDVGETKKEVQHLSDLDRMLSEIVKDEVKK